MGVFASNAPTIKAISPAKANCVVPRIAEAVPEQSLNLAIAKIVVFGIIKPSVARMLKSESSKSHNCGLKYAFKSIMKCARSIVKSAIARILFALSFFSDLVLRFAQSIKPSAFNPNKKAKFCSEIPKKLTKTKFEPVI